MPSTTPNHQSLRLMENHWPGSPQLLVAGDGPLHRGIMKGCNLCNHTKNYPSALAGKLMPTASWLPLADHLSGSHHWATVKPQIWHHHGCINCLSKCAHAVPTTSDVTAGCGSIVQRPCLEIHGLLRKSLATEGPNCMSNFTCSSANCWKSRLQRPPLTTHRQCQTERVNQEVEQFMWLVVNQHQDIGLNGCL